LVSVGPDTDILLQVLQPCAFDFSWIQSPDSTTVYPATLVSCRVDFSHSVRLAHPSGLSHYDPCHRIPSIPTLQNVSMTATHRWSTWRVVASVVTELMTTFM
jgi:hypothetical protein